MALTSSVPTKGNPPSLRLVPSKSIVLGMCAIASGRPRVESWLIFSSYCFERISLTSSTRRFFALTSILVCKNTYYQKLYDIHYCSCGIPFHHALDMSFKPIRRVNRFPYIKSNRAEYCIDKVLPHTIWCWYSHTLPRQKYWEMSLSIEPKIPALCNSKDLLRTTKRLGKLNPLTYSNL